ncbi:MAG: glycosyltransferase family 2 protein [Verrucomicrobia bacterium]|nr:glycosyltransferase family 2 protein [Verrucomicrobiota bacterium]
MQLSIVIPAYNEESRIGAMLEAYLPHFSMRYPDSVEMIVVVNGSTDRTAEVVERYAGQYPLLRCVVEPRAVGKGGALMIGFAECTGELVGFSDADGATPPKAFQALIDNIGDAGAIIASRWRPDSDVSPRQPLSRRIASRLFNLLVRILFGLPISDTQCGAKLLKRDVLQQILPELGLTRWAFDVDLLFQVRRAGWPIREIATTWHDVKGSKIKVVQASSEMFMSLVRLRLMHSPFKFLIRWIYPRFLPFVRLPKS